MSFGGHGIFEYFLFLFKIKNIQIQVFSSYHVLDGLVPDELLLFYEVKQSSLLGFSVIFVENWVYFVNKR